MAELCGLRAELLPDLVVFLIFSGIPLLRIRVLVTLIFVLVYDVGWASNLQHTIFVHDFGLSGGGCDLLTRGL